MRIIRNDDIPIKKMSVSELECGTVYLFQIDDGVSNNEKFVGMKVYDLDEPQKYYVIDLEIGEIYEDIEHYVAIGVIDAEIDEREVSYFVNEIPFKKEYEEKWSF